MELSPLFGDQGKEATE